MCETGSDQLMELASDLATHFGHEGPTHNIPGTRYIHFPLSTNMRDGAVAEARRAARARGSDRASGSTLGTAAAELLRVGSTTDVDRKTTSR